MLEEKTESLSNMDESKRDITVILGEINAGSQPAQGELIELAYDQLRRIAGGMMRREKDDHTLQPTALVNEAVLRLLGQLEQISGKDRAYFFGAMATAMRRVLVDHARSRNAVRRGGGQYQRQDLDLTLDALEAESKIDLLDLDEAMKRLAEFNPRQSEIVSLRFFGGLSIPEIAEHLDVSVSTVEKNWRIARAWLHSTLEEA
jgi:RNA polymerase sigma factor (TIGR02999 family)